RGAGIALEDLRDDRMEAGLRARSSGSGKCDVEATEPVHFESDVDCAKGSGNGSEGTARVRGANAARIHPVAGSCSARLAFDSGGEVHAAGGGILCLPKHLGV